MPSQTATQQEIANHLGLSLKGARNQLAKLGLDNKIHTLDHIRKTYIASLDSVGQTRSGQLDVTRERVKLMKAQGTKLKLETKNIRSKASEDTKPAIDPNNKELLSASMRRGADDINRFLELVSNVGKSD